MGSSELRNPAEIKREFIYCKNKTDEDRLQ
jgi:hypothetical protein